jgi:CubicO group peptidase (beta-lactamase class C family)
MWTPGDGSGYHPITWGYLAGEVVRRVAGQSLGTLLKNRITNADGAEESMEVIDFWIGTPAGEHQRCADLIRPTRMPELGELNEFRKAAFLSKWASPDRGSVEWRTTEIPSANGHGTAQSVARLYGIFANGGKLGDREILSEDAYQGLTQRRSLGEDRVLPYTIEFAAGVMRNADKIYGPNTQTLGHAGWGGSFGLGDPDRKLSAAYVMNKQSHYLQTDERGQRLIAALYGSL